MITVEIFIALTVILFALFIYIFADLENRLYGNMFAAGIGALLAALLALWSFSGNVAVVQPLLNTTSVINETTQETLHTYTTDTIPVVDASLGWLFVFIAIFLAILLGYLVYEAWMEQIEPEEEEEE